MPDDKKKTDPGDQGGPGDQGKVGEAGFPLEYVEKLRYENASGRVKFRDLEKRFETLEENIKRHVTESPISDELKKRNLTIEPSWIKIEKDKSVAESVDTFLKKYPQFESKSTEVDFTPRKETTQEKSTTTQEEKEKEKSTQKPMSTQKTNTNVQIGKVSDVGAIKKDPIARAKLRDHYHSLLGTKI